MKFNWQKIKEFSKSKYGKPLLFFGFYFIFFAIVFSLPINNNADKNNNSDKDILDKISNNYEYLYVIETSSGQTIELEGKKFNHKNLFAKKIDNNIDDEVYIFYDEVKVKKDSEWISNNSFVLVDESFDENLLNISYLKLLIADSEKMDSKTNFDGTKSDFYQFGNINIEVISANYILQKINVLQDRLSIKLQYRNINSVKDFVVEN